MNSPVRAYMLLTVFALTGGCSGMHSALDPAGPQASSIANLWWAYFSVCAAVYFLTSAYLVTALWRSVVPVTTIEPIEVRPVVRSKPAVEQRVAFNVTVLVGVTTLVLLVLLVGDFWTGRSLDALSEPKMRSIRLIGHQWWWEIHYEDEDPSQIVVTANELHLPVGHAVKIQLDSRDVIHSFWIPNLHGKRDMIPGHPTETHLKVDRPGIYWGQCAEFCGAQHANMRLTVVAESDEDFQRWLSGQRDSAAEPKTESERRGQEVFLGTTCVLCHRIRGTTAGSITGPDLTHLASRERIGAGAVENVRGHLAGWIVDPQRIKPGVRMPLNPLPTEDLNALIDYLKHLK